MKRSKKKLKKLLARRQAWLNDRHIQDFNDKHPGSYKLPGSNSK